ncbi:MAG: SdiA-regulated domain-containing protein [Chitinophagaceae bacterium]
MYKNTTLLVSYILLSLSFLSCGLKRENYANPTGYNFQKPFQYKLPLELDEISGLAFYKKDTSVFAVNDEAGWLYKLNLTTGKDIRRWKFSSGADFEDLVLLDSNFYVLQSNGNIIKIAIQKDGTLGTKDFPFPFGQDNEFEILYYDSFRNKLILICKDCETDKKKSLTTFSFDPQSGQFSDSSFSIDVKEIATTLKMDKLRFKPSAAAINPADSMLYIVSSVNKLLVITDKDGKFKKVYRINPSLFKQPEGITFTPSGSLIISNESGGVGVADILIFSNGKI